MGCGHSKVDDLPLVTFCKERKELIKSAADHRFALAAAHIAYFTQLRNVGDSLCRFVDEELVLTATTSSSSPSSPSSLSSPVLTLPSDDSAKKKGFHFGKTNVKTTTTTTASTDSNSHLPLSNSSSSELSSYHHHHNEDDDDDQHLEIDDEDNKIEDEENSNSKKKKGIPLSSSSPQPGISYIPPPTSNNNFNFPIYQQPFNPSYQFHQPPRDNNDNFYGNNVPYNSYNYPPQFQPQPQPSMYGYNDGFNGSNVYSSGNFYPDNNNENVYGNGGISSTSYTAYYMKKSSAKIPSVIYEEPQQNPIYSFSDYQNSNNYNYPPNVGQGQYPPNYPPNVGGGGGGYFGFMPNSGSPEEKKKEERRPPTPPSPKVTAWDYFNPFETFEGGGYPGYYVQPKSGYGSNTSSPDSREVREREGIPELEEETESEVTTKELYNERRKVVQDEKRVPRSKNKSVKFEDGFVRGSNGDSNLKKKKKSGDDFGEGTSNGVPMPMYGQQREVPMPTPMYDQQREVPPMPMYDQQRGVPMPMHNNQEGEAPEQFREQELESETVEVRDVKSSSPESDISISTSIEEVSVKKKGVSFDVGGGSHLDMESSKPSSLTTLSAHGTRDLREVVREIKDEFEAATDYGKEVSVLLEVEKEPYRSRKTFLKVMLASVCSTSLSSSHAPSNLTGGYPGDAQDDLDSRSLASTLEKLYVWEKKLYKEVKDEERLRVIYEKQMKKLKALDDRGAESSKVEATQASIRKLLTKINVSVKAVDSISSRIHKLRDDELEPQLKELIYGLRRMWKLMLKCHQKQFQAILESRTRALKANTGLRRDSSVRATIQLEAELLKWCHRFNNWVEMQRSYAETLNGWLEKCLHYEPEITSDGVVPFSPGRIGAPAVFVISHDWKQAMERISASEVQTAMHDFATSLHQLWERQDEEQRRRLKAENMYKDFEKQIRVTRMERQKRGHEHDDALSDKNSLSMVASESGISPLDDLKVDLDSMRQRVKEERAGHKEAVKLVHDAVSRSIQAGLIPIFEALESFTSEASKAFNDVRVEHVTAVS